MVYWSRSCVRLPKSGVKTSAFWNTLTYGAVCVRRFSRSDGPIRPLANVFRSVCSSKQSDRSLGAINLSKWLITPFKNTLDSYLYVSARAIQPIHDSNSLLPVLIALCVIILLLFHDSIQAPGCLSAFSYPRRFVRDVDFSLADLGLPTSDWHEDWNVGFGVPRKVIGGKIILGDAVQLYQICGGDEPQSFALGAKCHL